MLFHLSHIKDTFRSFHTEAKCIFLRAETELRHYASTTVLRDLLITRQLATIQLLTKFCDASM